GAGEAVGGPAGRRVAVGRPDRVLALGVDHHPEPRPARLLHEPAPGGQATAFCSGRLRSCASNVLVASTARPMAAPAPAPPAAPAAATCFSRSPFPHSPCAASLAS